MSEYGLFFDSRNGDRKYNASSMEEWLKPFFTTGVFNGELQVVSDGGMAIVVDPGYCNINGKVRCFESENHFTLATASGLYDRVDTVVIERNDVDREITMKVVQGGSDGQPVAPVREFGVYQLVLAQIYVGAGVTAITQANITDTRTDPDICGYVAATVTEIDFEQIMLQWNTFFNEWFDNIKGQLDTDVAGHLQNEIDELTEQEFNHYYELCNRNTQYIKEKGKIIGWTSEGDGVVATVEISENYATKTAVTTINKGSNSWIKTSVYNKGINTLTETYRRVGA